MNVGEQAQTMITGWQKQQQKHLYTSVRPTSTSHFDEGCKNRLEMKHGPGINERRRGGNERVTADYCCCFVVFSYDFKVSVCYNVVLERRNGKDK